MFLTTKPSSTLAGTLHFFMHADCRGPRLMCIYKVKSKIIMKEKDGPFTSWRGAWKDRDPLEFLMSFTKNKILNADIFLKKYLRVVQIMLSQHSTNKSIKIIIFKTKIPKPKQFLKKQSLQRIITCFKLFWVFLFPSLFLRRDLGFKALILS